HALPAKSVAIRHGRCDAEAEAVWRIPRQQAEIEIQLGADRRDGELVGEQTARLIADLAIGTDVRAPRDAIVAEERERAAIEEERQRTGCAADQEQRNSIFSRS